MYKKRTLLALAASSLLVSFVAQANKGAHYPNTHKTDADDFRWFVTAGAMYLTPSYDNLDYLDITSTSVTGARVTNTENVIPGFNWGYYLAAGYMIRDDFDVQATWTAFNGNTEEDASAAGPGVTVTLSNDRTQDLLAGQSASAESSEDLTFQQFDATLGQYHEIHDNLSTRVFAGVRYAKVDLDVDNVYSITGITVPVENDYDSSFWGVGPTIGMDLEYKIWDQVGIVGRLGAAFLVGEQEASSSTFWDSTPTQASVTADSETRIIPALDGKLGLNVDFPFNHFMDAIVVEGGYQANYYFNVINEINNTAGTATYSNNYSDVGMMGPYLNISARW